MTSYLLYSDYQDMGGTLDEPTFNDISYEAQVRIDWYTFDRLKEEAYEDITEPVKRCMYMLIKLIQDERNTTGIGTEEGTNAVGGTVASQSNDGVSISYNVLSAGESAQLIEQKLKKTVRMYLQGAKNSLGQKLLYRGLYKGE